MSPSPLDTKDRRSYEHSRQQHLHPSDRYSHQSKNAAKGKRHFGNSQRSRWIGTPQSGTKWLPSITTDDISVDVDVDYVSSEEEVDEAVAPLPLEISLTDLVRPARQRKGMFLSHYQSSMSRGSDIVVFV